MSDLNDWVATLERSVAPPSMFETYFPNATDDDLAGALADAFCEAQLDGFFTNGYDIDLDSNVVTPDLDNASLRLVTIYAAVVIIRTQILNTKSKALYKAGTAESDVEYSPNVLTAVLKSMEAAKTVTIQRLMQSGAAYAISMVDQYYIRATAPLALYGPYGIGMGGGYEDRAYDYVDPWAS